MIENLELIQAAADSTRAYGSFGSIGGRGAVWVAAQVHLMFAAFVLGVPMFGVITELIGIVKKDSKFDKPHDTAFRAHVCHVQDFLHH